MSPDDDIKELLAAGQAELGFDLLWQRYRVPCVRFLTQRFPTAPDDEVASAVTDAFLQLFDSDKKRSLAEDDYPLYHQLFFFANRRLIDAYRKRTAQRRGGNAEWLVLEESGAMAADHHGALTDEILINEVRRRLELLGEGMRSEHQRGILAIIGDALPERIYLSDFESMMIERGMKPPRPATMKRSLQEVRRKLADDPVLRNLRAEVAR
ncbi:MAG: DNA-directed RNA polymerase specialized sigma24 family protein [Verrucomicrobiales bacterium]|jgi:DNA-directed RNA polymerase specialized sigma24 family protein